MGFDYGGAKANGSQKIDYCSVTTARDSIWVSGVISGYERIFNRGSEPAVICRSPGRIRGLTSKTGG